MKIPLWFLYLVPGIPFYALSILYGLSGKAGFVPVTLACLLFGLFFTLTLAAIGILIEAWGNWYLARRRRRPGYVNGRPETIRFFVVSILVFGSFYIPPSLCKMPGFEWGIYPCAFIYAVILYGGAAFLSIRDWLARRRDVGVTA